MSLKVRILENVYYKYIVLSLFCEMYYCSIILGSLKTFEFILKLYTYIKTHFVTVNN